VFIRVADDCQPQSVFGQMMGDILGERSSVIFRAEGVKTSSIKYKAERSAFNFVMEKINKYEITLHAGFGSFFFCLL